MFDIDQFIADCRAALAADKSHKSVREIVARGSEWIRRLSLLKNVFGVGIGRQMIVAENY